MKTLLITLAIIEAIQFIVLLACIMTDAMEIDEEYEKAIQSKRDVLKFFIPFFWFIPMLNMIIKWWNKLK
jgi:hypothetical protein